MLDKTTIVKVTNRDNGTVGYTIPELHLHRSFASGETKEILLDELRKLTYLPGGQVILRDLLVLDNKEAIAELLSDVEPEYFYTAETVKTLLLDGTIDQLMDCLDFAPKGVVDLVKSTAVELEINDIKKRNIITEKTGFNINKAIEINQLTAIEEEVKVSSRRSTPITTEKKDTETDSRERTKPVFIDKYNVTK